MGFLDSFPYTNFHELNLDWVLQKIKEYDSFFKDIDEKMTELFRMYPELAENVYQTRYMIQQLEAVVKANYSELKTRLDMLDFATREELYQQIAQLTKMVDQNVKSLLNEIKLARNYTDLKIKDVYIALNDDVDNLQKQINRVLIEPVQKVINPVTKLVDTVQNTVDDLYTEIWDNVWLFFSLSAKEYDGLFLTAKQYDDKQLTAKEYDYTARWFLGPVPWDDLRYRPLGIDAGEWDALTITAEQYDKCNLTARQYDDKALWYFGPYPFKSDTTTGDIYSTMFPRVMSSITNYKTEVIV